MKGDLRALKVHQPRDVREAVELRAGADRPIPIAGGTDLFVALNDGKRKGDVFLDLSRLRALRGVLMGPGPLRIGAMTTYTDLRRSPLIAKRAPVLAAVARDVGAIAIQNRGTLGGSLGNASPASDPAPVLLALDATIEAFGPDDRTRLIPISEFFTGYRQTALAPDELIVAVYVPRHALPAAGWKIGYRKVGTRRAQAISKVVLASAVKLGKGRRVEGVRLAFGSMAATTVRARRAEAALLGEILDAAAIVRAQDALSEDLHPIDDIRSTAQYRMQVARNLLAAQLTGTKS